MQYKIGVWYQSGHKLVACYKAIESFRKIYPTEKIDLIEDGSRKYDIIRDKFQVNLTQINQSGLNTAHYGRPVHNLDTNLKWLERIYNSCTGYLNDADFIVLFEDDVWCKQAVTKYPDLDLEGANGPLWKPELFNYLCNLHGESRQNRGHWSRNGSLESYGACGGTVFKRTSFIEAYNNLKNINWEEIYKLDTRPVEWSDASLSFVFQHANLKTGIWADWTQYDTKGQGNWFDKTGWSTPMSEQPGVAFLHAYKHFYNYADAELRES
jgi:hypothetical protein